MEECGHRVTVAAIRAGTNRTHLYNTLYDLGVVVPHVPDIRNRPIPSDAKPAQLTYRDAVRKFEARYWAAALSDQGGRVQEAARVTGKNRTELYRIMRSLGLYVAPPRRGNWGDLTN